MVACLLAVFKGLVLNEEFQVGNAGILFAGALVSVNLATLLLSECMARASFR